MSKGWLDFLKDVVDPPLHRLDHALVRMYVKQRLAVVYPELRRDPHALEAAYRTLSLEPRPGVGNDEAPTVFELILPDPVKSQGLSPTPRKADPAQDGR